MVRESRKSVLITNGEHVINIIERSKIVKD